MCGRVHAARRHAPCDEKGTRVTGERRRTEMTRLDALALLLADIRDNDTEEHKAVMHLLLRSLGYDDVLEAFDDLIDRSAVERVFH